MAFMLKIFISLLLLLLFSYRITCNIIAIYKGKGVWDSGAKNLQKRLSYSTSSSYKILFMDAKEIENNLNNIRLIIIPGGRDIPYTEAFSLELLDKIREWLKEGGSLFGICAGAYFSSSEIEFEKGTINQIIGPRMLKLFLGKAVGAIKGGLFNPIAIDITCSSEKTGEPSMKLQSFYYGGCWFENLEKDETIKILAKYSQDEKPAIIWNNYGLGKFVLSGVHPEISARFVKDDIILQDELKKYSFENRILWVLILKTLGIKTKIPVLTARL